MDKELKDVVVTLLLNDCAIMAGLVDNYPQELTLTESQRTSRTLLVQSVLASRNRVGTLLTKEENGTKD